MTSKEFRTAVFDRILTWQAASFPTLPVVTENGPQPDENTIGRVWLDCEIRYYGGHNITMGLNPIGRMTGAVSTQVFYREAEGTGQVDDILDSLTTLLKNTRLGSGTLQFPQRTVPTCLRGWYKSGLLVPFYLDIA